jgi:hypothetical protein
MPTCEKCSEYFPTWITIDKKKRNLSRRKYCLTCSPFGQHNTISLHRHLIMASFPEGQLPTHRDCADCNQHLTIECFGVHNRMTRDRKMLRVSNICKKCDALRYVNRKRCLKEQAVKYKGGCCSKCGYNTCLRSLDFHHLDDKIKEFSISSYVGMNFEDIKTELDKCILVCRNCHGEIHDEIEQQKRYRY